jgi:hypothetical protein
MIPIIYYAHAIEIFNTEQERQELELIEMFFYHGLVFNPNRISVRFASDPMRMCLDTVKDESISALVFGEVNGEITQGVEREIRQARKYGKPILYVNAESVVPYIDEIEIIPKKKNRYRRKQHGTANN